jgi:hypothetical protein
MYGIIAINPHIKYLLNSKIAHTPLPIYRADFVCCGCALIRFILLPLGVTSSPEGPTRTCVCVPARRTVIRLPPPGNRSSTISSRLRAMNHGSAHISDIFARVFGLRSNMRPIRGRHEGGLSLWRSFMGPLLMGAGGGVSTFLRSVEEGTWSIAFPEAMSWESVWTRVALEEVWVVLREMVVDVEAELLGVV